MFAPPTAARFGLFVLALLSVAAQGLGDDSTTAPPTNAPTPAPWHDDKHQAYLRTTNESSVYHLVKLARRHLAAWEQEQQERGNETSGAGGVFLFYAGYAFNEAFQAARDQRHEFMTVEHLLLAIIDIPEVYDLLRTLEADVNRLRRELKHPTVG